MLLIVCTVLVWSARQRGRQPPPLKLAQLTANPSELPVLSAGLSPDGKYLAYSDSRGLLLHLLQTGETKYGKPILDRVITPATTLADASSS